MQPTRHTKPTVTQLSAEHTQYLTASYFLHVVGCRTRCCRRYTIWQKLTWASQVLESKGNPALVTLTPNLRALSQSTALGTPLSFPVEDLRMSSGAIYCPPDKRQLSQQDLPCHPENPSLAVIGTITKPATGSVHHSPKSALRSRPPSRIADRYVQKSVWRASAAIAALPRAIPTRLLAWESRGIASKEATAVASFRGALQPGRDASRLALRIRSNNETALDPIGRRMLSRATGFPEARGRGPGHCFSEQSHWTAEGRLGRIATATTKPEDNVSTPTATMAPRMPN